MHPSLKYVLCTRDSCVDKKLFSACIHRPDIWPCDFHVFPRMKRDTTANHFNKMTNCRARCVKWRWKIERVSLEDAIHKSVPRYDGLVLEYKFLPAMESIFFFSIPYNLIIYILNSLLYNRRHQRYSIRKWNWAKVLDETNRIFRQEYLLN